MKEYGNPCLTVRSVEVYKDLYYNDRDAALPCCEDILIAYFSQNGENASSDHIYLQQEAFKWKKQR